MVECFDNVCNFIIAQGKILIFKIQFETDGI